MPVNTADLLPGGGGGNNPGGLVANTGIGTLSSGTAGSAILPVYAFSDDSLGFYQSATSTIAQSYGTLRLPPLVDGFTNVTKLSLTTFASAAGMVAGELRIVFQASGITLMYSSGATQYTIAGSSTSLAQS